MPYLLDAIGVNIGWIFGGVSVLATVYAYLRVPEISGRSLEELDELFESKVPARKFSTTETHGAARRITELESRGAVVEEAKSTRMRSSSGNKPAETDTVETA